MNQRGFTLIEAIVALSLFSLLFVGATLLLSTYETQNSQLRKLTNQQSISYSFLQEWGNLSRRMDRTSSGARPLVSVLDGFSSGVDFKEAIQSFSNRSVDTLYRQWRERLENESGNSASWVLTVENSADHYRTLTLEVDGTETQYHICCAP